MINLSPLLNNKNEKKPLSEVFELKNSKPTIINTAGKVVTGIGGFVKDILLEAPARAAAALTLEAAKQESLKPTSPIEKFFLEDEEVKKVSTMIEEAGKTGRELFVGKEAKTFGEVAGKVLAIGLVALDLTPFGGIRKNLVKTLTSLKNVKKIEVVLKNAGVADDLIAIYAPKFAKLKKSKEVSEGLKSLESVIKETKNVQTIATDVIKGVDTELAKEAIKYDTASEFIKAQGIPVYHGGTKIKEVGNMRSKWGAFYMTDNPTYAKSYGGNKSVLNKMVITKKAKLADLIKPSDDLIKQIDEIISPKATGETIKIKKPDGSFVEVPKTKGGLSNPVHSSADIIQGIKDGKAYYAEMPEVKEALKKLGYDGMITQESKFGVNYGVWNKKVIKTESQLIAIWNESQNAIKTTAKAVKKEVETKPEAFTTNALEIGATNKLPMVVRGETFIFSGGLKPATMERVNAKEAFKQYKIELRATQKEINNAKKAEEKALKLIDKQRVLRETTLRDFQKYTKGSIENITNNLKKRFLSDEDIDNIILENGVKLNDVLRVKRNADGSLRSVIKKSDIENIKSSYTGKKPTDKWIEKSTIADIAEKTTDLTRGYELPKVFFERKGLKEFIYDPMVDAARGAEILKNSYINRFKESGLWKEGGWFTADRFNISKSESENISKYYLSRQGKGFPSSTFNSLSEKEKTFVKVFDSIIEDSSPRFYEVAKKNGLTPGVIENYAPIATKKELRLTETKNPMEWLIRNHPSFSSLKERTKKVPQSMYEMDYREVAARWLDGITKFNVVGDVSPEIKALIKSEEFSDIIKSKDLQYINKWYKDFVQTSVPDTPAEEAVDWASRVLRKGVAIAALGLNYASVAVQALTHIPLLIIERVAPKTKSKYAEAFGIKVSDLPSITKRKGDIAISDLQGKIGRIFTGPLTEFDKKNAQLSLNALLDKEYSKVLKEGIEITEDTRKIIERKAQDTLDMWYGGFFDGQRPEYFRSSLGNFINMFIYPLTSQLNGFYRHILTAEGVGKKAIAGAEVLASATAIAYMEQVISNLSFNWSDEKEMAKNVLESLIGNIPIVSQIAYAAMNDKDFQISAGTNGIVNLLNKFSKINKEGGFEDVIFATAELAGLPKQIRKVKDGLEIINAGGIIDKDGKMQSPVKEADEVIRTFLMGKYGSIAAKDWLNNLPTNRSVEERRWFVPEVEFLQNGDYDRKAEIYETFSFFEKRELLSYLSDRQKKMLDSAIVKRNSNKKRSVNTKPLSNLPKTKEELEAMFKK